MSDDTDLSLSRDIVGHRSRDRSIPPQAISYLFFGKTHRLATIHTVYVTGERQTDGRSTAA